MGYPMSYDRVISRNFLTGDYDPAGKDPQSLLKGDLRRLERDVQDDEHVRSYAHHSGVTEAQVRLIFKMFFEGPTPNWRDANPPRWQRECVHQVFRKEGDRIVVAPGALREWPHIAAILAGTVAGDFRDWPKVRAELLDFIRVHQCGDSQFVACTKREGGNG